MNRSKKPRGRRATLSSPLRHRSKKMRQTERLLVSSIALEGMSDETAHDFLHGYGPHDLHQPAFTDGSRSRPSPAGTPGTTGHACFPAGAGEGLAGSGQPD